MALLPTAQQNTALDALFTTSTTYYLSLHTSSPGTTGANEVTGGSYARQSIVFAAASSGSKASNTSQSFTSMPAVTIAYLGVWTASTGGTYLGGGSLGTSPSLPSGSTVNFASGAVTATVS